MLISTLSFCVFVSPGELVLEKTKKNNLKNFNKAVGPTSGRAR
jgi:hypothetical protein